jgi:hypothetical protein
LCPACGGKRVLPIIWGWNFLIEGEKADAEAGLVILGCRHESGVRFGRNVPRHHPEVLGAPDWACLDCEPGWVDVHNLALEEEELQEAKGRALASGGVDAAWECLKRQDAINDRIVQCVRGLTSPKRSRSISAHLGRADPGDQSDS